MSGHLYLTHFDIRQAIPCGAFLLDFSVHLHMLMFMTMRMRMATDNGKTKMGGPI